MHWGRTAHGQDSDERQTGDTRRAKQFAFRVFFSQYLHKRFRFIKGFRFMMMDEKSEGRRETAAEGGDYDV